MGPIPGTVTDPMFDEMPTWKVIVHAKRQTLPLTVRAWTRTEAIHHAESYVRYSLNLPSNVTPLAVVQDAA